MKQLVKAEKLIRIVRGLYETDGSIPGYYLAPIIYGPSYLSFELAQSGKISGEKHLSIEDVKEMLRERFENIDNAQAKQDIIPFIKNPDAIAVWSADFFCEITEKLTAVV